MKRQIRQGLFETNSSSTHAICISKDHDISKLTFPNSVSFDHGEFGWECRKLMNIREKASYLYEAVLGMYRYNNPEEKINRIKEILNKYDITCDFELSSDNVGYIDHVRTDDMSDWLEKMMNDDESLLTYLFGDAFVVTGNDNDDGFDEMMCEYLGEEKTWYGTYPKYGGYKKEYDNYDIYYKGN